MMKIKELSLQDCDLIDKFKALTNFTNDELIEKKILDKQNSIEYVFLKQHHIISKEIQKNLFDENDFLIIKNTLNELYNNYMMMMITELNKDYDGDGKSNRQELLDGTDLFKNEENEKNLFLEI